jgi:hypothetical protein
MDNKLQPIIAKYQKQLIRGVWYLLLILLSFRGLGGYWGDLKDYIVASELGKKSVVVKVDANQDKYKEIKERVFKEKGIVLTDKDIEQYGFNK